jgi:L-fuconate dehydratase
MLKEKATTKAEREAHVREVGYPAYVTSAGWLGYSDEKIARLTKEAVAGGFNHFKMKVGADQASDIRRGKIIRSIIDDPQYLPAGHEPRDPNGPDLVGKNAGPTGSVLMIDANQVWDVPEAIEYVKGLQEIKPWLVSRCLASTHCLTLSQRFIEEPTAPDDILGHAAIREALKPYGIGVATGEHAHNRMIFKQLLQANAIDVCQIDSCRLAGVSEVLSVLLMAAKFGIPVCPHAGGVGLCEYVIHLRLVD